MPFRVLLLSIFLFIGAAIHSQVDYTPFEFNNNCIWYEGKLGVGFGYHEWFDINYLIDGDTIIGELNYRKLLISDVECGIVEYHGAIREDLIERKVYYLPSNESLPAGTCFEEFEDEQLLYDFDLSLGDFVEIPSILYPLETYSFEVTGVEEILVGESIRNRWTLVNGLETHKWIEGIGDSSGLLHSLTPPEFDFCGSFVCGFPIMASNLSCYLNDGIEFTNDFLHYYIISINEDCTVFPVGIEEQLEMTNLFEVSPNPATDQITITFQGVHGGDTQLLLHNSLGDLVKRSSVVSGRRACSLDLSELSAGLYQLSQVEGNKVVQTEKIIVR